MCLYANSPNFQNSLETWRLVGVGGKDSVTPAKKSLKTNRHLPIFSFMSYQASFNVLILTNYLPLVNTFLQKIENYFRKVNFALLPVDGHDSRQTRLGHINHLYL